MASASEETAPALARGQEALARGAWLDARTAFEQALACDESPEALEGLALATLWLDDDRVLGSLERAYTLFRKNDDRLGAARSALWLGLATYYLRGRLAVANGWLGRADRLLEGLGPSSESGARVGLAGPLRAACRARSRKGRPPRARSGRDRSPARRPRGRDAGARARGARARDLGRRRRGHAAPRRGDRRGAVRRALELARGLERLLLPHLRVQARSRLRPGR